MSSQDQFDIEQLIHEAQTAPLTEDFTPLAISLLDLTNLDENASEDDIAKLCQKALTPRGPCAAICIYPKFIKFARSCLKDERIKIASVANFPHGKAHLEQSLAEIRTAIEDGVNEIDLVVPYHSALTGNIEQIYHYTKACKEICGAEIVLKVILETGALSSFDLIYQLSETVIEAGADFVKTSTGKIETGATLEAAIAILTAIKKSNRAVGFKAAGGIRQTQQAAAYLYLIQKILGPEWLTPTRTRLGASSLLDQLLEI